MRLYLRFISAYLKSLAEYRFLFIMDMFLQIVTYALELAGIWILLNKFNNLMGWTFDELLLVYLFDLCSYSLAGMFVKHPMLDMETMVRTGTFDGILTKPINPLFHVIARQFQHGFIGHLTMCLFLFPYCFNRLGISLNVLGILCFVVMLLGATLIQAAFMIVAGSMSFLIVRSQSVVEAFIYDVRRIIKYPISIYPFALQLGLTFVVPYAFVNFYPAQLFPNKGGDTLLHPALVFMTPVVGIVLILLAVRLWCFGVSKYQSTGS